MKRKVIKQGHNTLTVTLPAKWVKENNLLPGAEVELLEKDRDLLITTQNTDVSKKATIRVMRPKRLVSRHIFNLYRKGVDEIRIHYDDPIIIKDIYKFIPLLMGFEISVQGTDHTVIRNVLSIKDKEFDSSMRRYLLVTKSLAEESYNALKAGEIEKLEGIMELEKVQNRLYLFLSRTVSKRPDIVKEPLLHYLFIQRVEDLADDYKYLLGYMIENKMKKLSTEVLGLLMKANQLLFLLYDYYYKYDLKTAHAILEGKKKLMTQGMKLLERVGKKEVRAVSIINSLSVKIYEAASPVYGIHL